MKRYFGCEICLNAIATELHHKFSQSRVNKKLYGKLIHHESNMVRVCSACHHFKPIPKWSEIEFCEALDIEPRSKVALGIWAKNRPD